MGAILNWLRLRTHIGQREFCSELSRELSGMESDIISGRRLGVSDEGKTP